MVTAIKQIITVGAGGRVALQSPELHEGESAEVIVMVDRSEARTPNERLLAMERVRARLKLTPEMTERWVAEVREERAAWGPATPGRFIWTRAL